MGLLVVDVGFRVGDWILEFDDYWIVIFFDVIWVLEFWGDGEMLLVWVERNGWVFEIIVELLCVWREMDILGWRVFMGVVGLGGGFWGRFVNGNEWNRYGFIEDDLVILINFVWVDYVKVVGICNGDIFVGLEDL